MATVPSPYVQNATGTTITFDSGFFAQITKVDWSGIKRKAIETSHMGQTATPGGKAGNATFTQGKISDPGEMKVEIHYNPDTVPPIDSAAETVTVTFPSGCTWAASAYMTDYSFQGELDGKYVATATLKFSGPITVTLKTS
jgi:hypothetical protein